MNNFKWPQGEDFHIQLLYKEGDTAAKAKAVDLSGYALRMDLASGASILYSFESEDHPGTLTSGADGQPNIDIILPRSLTLPTGELYNAGPVQYDIFLRNLATNRQFKLLRGTITFEKSVTLWQ